MTRKNVKYDDDVSGRGGQKTIGNPGARLYLRGKRGILKDMPDMPVDILLEIFSHLQPADMLNLARTTKPFRAFLMSRSSSTFWKVARQNVEALPDCPPYLSEPAYANLLFFPYCHKCLKGNIQNILWSFSARYCKNCKIEMTMTSESLNLPSEMTELAYQLSCVPPLPSLGGRYHLPDHSKLMRDWSVLGGDAEKQMNFLIEQTSLLFQIQQHVAACEQWSHVKKIAQLEERSRLVQRCREDILSKLRGLGYEEELRLIDHNRRYYQFQRLLHQAASKQRRDFLTDLAWAKTGKPLIEILQSMKETRLKSELTQHMAEAHLKQEQMKAMQKARLEEEQRIYHRLLRLSDLVDLFHQTSLKNSGSICMPDFVDFAHMPDFRFVAEAWGDIEDGTESTTDVDLYLALYSLLPTIADQWLLGVKDQLITLVSSGRPSKPDVDPLVLASTIFYCSICSGGYKHYPEILSHRCHYTHDKTEDIYEDVLGKMNLGWRRQISKLAVDVDYAAAVVEACGLNPDSATQEEMDALQVRLSLANSETNAQIVMNWRSAAVYHAHNQKSSFEWVAIFGEDVLVAQRIESANVMLDEQYCWCCAYCTGREGLDVPLLWVQQHCLSQHDIMNASVENGDIFINMGRGLPSKPVMLLSSQRTESLSDMEREWLQAGRADFRDSSIFHKDINSIFDF